MNFFKTFSMQNQKSLSLEEGDKGEEGKGLIASW